MPDQPFSETPEADYAPTVLPSTGVRALAFAAIMIAGLCGGLIGYSFVTVQCDGDCTVAAGATGLGMAVAFAIGVGIVAVLAMRAMGEWRNIQHQSRRDVRK